MAQGIVVKIWNVSAGTGKRGAAAQISDSINYINNPEKTGEPLADMSIQQLGNELRYVANDMKTVAGLYVGGRHISAIENATEEMMEIKEFYGKLGGRVATHGIISLDESESDPKNAGKLMELLNDLMEQVFPHNQVVYAVHTNTENLHIHFIVNTVGLDGKKIHMDKLFMRKVLEPAVNELAEKYGFTPNETWRKIKKKDPLPLPQRKMLLRDAVDRAIEQTDSFDALVAFLRSEGFIVNIGSNMTLQEEEMAFAMKSSQLGKLYSLDEIRRRLDEKYDPFKSVGLENYYANILPDELINFTPHKMKPYKDMTKDEKIQAVKLLRLGRNPWEEARFDNWQMKKSADELKNIGYVYKLVRYYSGGTENASDAMKEIVKARNKISEEKKEIRELMREYKPILKIYDELKSVMVRAYLYDRYGYSEYKSEFDRYERLSERLIKGYGKSIDEVADMAFELDSKLIYLKAEDKNLAQQYKAIKDYLDNGKLEAIADEYSFFQAVGHSQALYDAKRFGIYTTNFKEIRPEGESIVIQVMTRPAMKDGKATVETLVRVIDKDGDSVKEIASSDISEKEFNKEIYNIQKEYGIKKCNVSRKNYTENARHIL